MNGYVATPKSGKEFMEELRDGELRLEEAASFKITNSL